VAQFFLTHSVVQIQCYYLIKILTVQPIYLDELTQMSGEMLPSGPRTVTAYSFFRCFIYIF